MFFPRRPGCSPRLFVPLFFGLVLAAGCALSGDLDANLAVDSEATPHAEGTIQLDTDVHRVAIDIDMAATGEKRQVGTVTVAIVDSGGAPSVGLDVLGEFDGGASASVVGTTNAYGIATLRSPELAAGEVLTFQVEDIDVADVYLNGPETSPREVRVIVQQGR